MIVCLICTLHNEPNAQRCAACNNPLPAPEYVVARPVRPPNGNANPNIPVASAVPSQSGRANSVDLSMVSQATKWVNESQLSELEKNLVRVHLAQNPASAAVLMATPQASRLGLVRSLIGSTIGGGSAPQSPGSAASGPITANPVGRLQRGNSGAQRPFANLFNLLSALPASEAKDSPPQAAIGNAGSSAVVSNDNLSNRSIPNLNENMDEERKMNLQGIITPRQREQFLRDGYLLLKGLVPVERCDVAVRYIESPLNQQSFMDQAVNMAMTFGDQASGVKVKMNNDVNGLYKGSLVEKLARNLVSDHLQSPWGAQVAPIPGRPDLSPALVGVARAVGNFGVRHTDLINKWKLWHIDGVDIKRNEVRAARKFNFTLLCGVYLTNISADFAGNFCVFPGSHLQIQEYAKQRGTTEIEQEGLHAELIPLGVPIQLRPQAGDVMFAHYQLAHTVAPNLSPNTRHAVYFRLFHKDHPHFKFRHESMTDVWLEYEKMWPLLQREK